MTEMLEPASTDGTNVTAPGQQLPSSSARFGAFTDAVVAIAMTLLILPLMEAVPGNQDPEPPVLDFIIEHRSQLTTFAISFILIGMFWVMHHRVFRADTPGSSRRTMINFVWLFTVVLMPVTTALSGATATDRLMLAIYDGNLLVSSCALLALTQTELVVRRKNELITPNRTILAAPLAMSILFALVLGAAMIVPQASYFLLFAMVFTGPLRALLVRLGLRDKAGAQESNRV